MSPTIGAGWRLLGLLAVAAALLTVAAGPLLPARAARPAGYTADYRLGDCAFASVGRTTYMILEPGYRLVLAGSDEGEAVELTITVLDQTRLVGAVETRVVEERETKGGALVEVSRNYFALCRQTGSIFYFGEEVDIYEGGAIVGHDGAWLAGVDGARAGLMMPGQPLLGARYHQEVAPGVALDRAEIVADAAALATPLGRYTGCLRTAETTPLEPKVTEYKTYAPGVGLIQDGPLTLVQAGPNAAPPEAGGDSGDGGGEDGDDEDGDDADEDAVP